MPPLNKRCVLPFVALHNLPKYEMTPILGVLIFGALNASTLQRETLRESLRRMPNSTMAKLPRHILLSRFTYRRQGTVGTSSPLFQGLQWRRRQSSPFDSLRQHLRQKRNRSRIACVVIITPRGSLFAHLSVEIDQPEDLGNFNLCSGSIVSGAQIQRTTKNAALRLALSLSHCSAVFFFCLYCYPDFK